MKWVTWADVGVDRMACAWLIRRAIDPEAEFLFVPADQQPLPEGAEPFDIPGVRLSHHSGHCTFHSLLDAYELTDPVLHRIARIVDEADIVQDHWAELPTRTPYDLATAADGRLIYIWEQPAPFERIEMAHPEWSTTIYSRVRARMLLNKQGKPNNQYTGMLTLAPSAIVAVRGDALYLTSDPGWHDDHKSGALRVKETLTGPFHRPANFGELDRLRREQGH
jgi:Chromate resistance exported protein